ncbi:hypothetical protein KKC31_01160, partial [Patescibacteria group bacterium]|nr:hypothetical protein [Patescibacteria group bacterium]
RNNLTTRGTGPCLPVAGTVLRFQGLLPTIALGRTVLHGSLVCLGGTVTKRGRASASWSTAYKRSAETCWGGIPQVSKDRSQAVYSRLRFFAIAVKAGLRHLFLPIPDV